MVAEGDSYGDDAKHPAYVAQWYIVGSIVVASLATLVGLTACAYKCYSRRTSASSTSYSSVPGRLTSVIKKSLKDTGGRKLPKDNEADSEAGSAADDVNNEPEEKFLRTDRPNDFPEKLSGNNNKPIKADQANAELAKSSTKSASRLFSAGQRVAPPPMIPITSCHVEKEGSDGDEKSAEKMSNESIVRRNLEIAAKINASGGEGEKMTSNLGQLNFTVEYDQLKATLVVTILKACNLPIKDPSQGGQLDPYVKLQLLPEKRHKVKTRVLRKTQNPVYDETFTFYELDRNHLEDITLHFIVLSFDRYSRDDVIGEIIYPLAEIGQANEQKEVVLMKEIAPRHMKLTSQGRGEMLISLCYQPAANRLSLVVLKIRNLPKMDITGLSDPYVKVFLLYNGQRIGKKKTHVKKRTLNPVFNESFLFDVPPGEGLQSVGIELQVLDFDRVTKNEVVGRLELGVNAAGSETRHWKEVMNCPRKQIAEWHKLKE